MESPIYNICFPDIFNQIASYLDVSDIADLARTNSQFAQFVRETGLLYRNVNIAFKYTKSRRKATSDECIRKFLPCLQQAPQNAARLTCLSIRHRFSGYLPHEEITYVERIAAITKLTPNLTSLSLHLSNFAATYYVDGPNSEWSKIPEGATRAFFCQRFADLESDPQQPRLIDSLLESLDNLRSLDWCVECRPSGLLSEDWKASRLREELEMIDRACPKLERLGLLNFFDSRVSDSIIHEIDSNGTNNFILDGDNAVSGILANLREITFHVPGERDQEKILSAAVLGIALGRWRRIKSTLVPWRQEKDTPTLIIDNITNIKKIQELTGLQLGISLEEFVEIWGQYVEGNMTFEVSILPDNSTQLDLLNILSSKARSVNVALKINEISTNQIRSIVLPPQTKSLSIETDCLSLPSIKKLTAPLDLRSLKITFNYTYYDETDEKVMLQLTRDHPSQDFSTEWASEPILSFNMAIWGDMVMCDYGENLFEAVVGRAIGRTTWESRKYLESVTRNLFETSSNLTHIDVVASYPLFKVELSTPRLFKL